MFERHHGGPHTNSTSWTTVCTIEWGGGILEGSLHFMVISMHFTVILGDSVLIHDHFYAFHGQFASLTVKCVEMTMNQHGIAENDREMYGNDRKVKRIDREMHGNDREVKRIDREMRGNDREMRGNDREVHENDRESTRNRRE
jgi:hypothetical protein